MCVCLCVCLFCLLGCTDLLMNLSVYNVYDFLYVLCLFVCLCVMFVCVV